MKGNQWVWLIVIFIVGYLVGIYFPATGQTAVAKLQSFGG